MPAEALGYDRSQEFKGNSRPSISILRKREVTNSDHHDRPLMLRESGKADGLVVHNELFQLPPSLRLSINPFVEDEASHERETEVLLHNLECLSYVSEIHRASESDLLKVIDPEGRPSESQWRDYENAVKISLNIFTGKFLFPYTVHRWIVRLSHSGAC